MSGCATPGSRLTPPRCVAAGRAAPCRQRHVLAVLGRVPGGVTSAQRSCSHERCGRLATPFAVQDGTRRATVVATIRFPATLADMGRKSPALVGIWVVATALGSIACGASGGSPPRSATPTQAAQVAATSTSPPATATADPPTATQAPATNTVPPALPTATSVPPTATLPPPVAAKPTAKPTSPPTYSLGESGPAAIPESATQQVGGTVAITIGGSPVEVTLTNLADLKRRPGRDTDRRDFETTFLLRNRGDAPITVAPETVFQAANSGRAYSRGGAASLVSKDPITIGPNAETNTVLRWNTPVYLDSTKDTMPVWITINAPISPQSSVTLGAGSGVFRIDLSVPR
jgi:hypothetical protein